MENLVIAYIEENNGATIHKGTIIEPECGYQVGIGELFTTKDLGFLLQIIDYLLEHYDDFGIWYDNDDQIYVIDKCIYVENLDDAINLGKLNEQKAIYDWKTQDDIKL
jgi:hypothetical protein